MKNDRRIYFSEVFFRKVVFACEKKSNKQQNLLIFIAWLLVGVATNLLQKTPCDGSLYFQAVVSKCNFDIMFSLEN